MEIRKHRLGIVLVGIVQCGAIVCVSGLFLICLLAWSVEALAKVPGKVKRVMKSTVLLTHNGDPYCSGFVAKDGGGTSHVWTAAHCCAESLKRRTSVHYVHRSRDYRSVMVTPGDLDPTRTDICRLPGTANRHETKLQIVDIPWIDNPGEGQVRDRYLWMVQPFPKWDQIALKLNGVKVVYKGSKARYQPIYRVTPNDTNFRETFVVGMLLPGMSGSPLVTEDGGVVGVISKWDPMSVFPLGRAAMFNTAILD